MPPFLGDGMGTRETLEGLDRTIASITTSASTRVGPNGGEERSWSGAEQSRPRYEYPT